MDTKNENLMKEIGELLAEHAQEILDQQNFPDRPEKNFGRYLRASRDSSRFTIAKLAQCSNVAESEILAYELGLLPKKCISTDSLKMLADALDEDINIFLLILESDKAHNEDEQESSIPGNGISLKKIVTLSCAVALCVLTMFTVTLFHLDRRVNTITQEYAKVSTLQIETADTASIKPVPGYTSTLHADLWIQLNGQAIQILIPKGSSITFPEGISDTISSIAPEFKPNFSASPLEYVPDKLSAIEDQKTRHWSPASNPVLVDTATQRLFVEESWKSLMKSIVAVNVKDSEAKGLLLTQEQKSSEPLIVQSTVTDDQNNDTNNISFALSLDTTKSVNNILSSVGTQHLIREGENPSCISEMYYSEPKYYPLLCAYNFQNPDCSQLLRTGSYLNIPTADDLLNLPQARQVYLKQLNENLYEDFLNNSRYIWLTSQRGNDYFCQSSDWDIYGKPIANLLDANTKS